MHVGRDLLDRQLVDRDDNRLGRVDGIVAELRDGAPPRVVQFELGAVPLMRRISLRLERLAEALHRRFGVRRSARYGIPWSLVLRVETRCITVDVEAETTVAYDWENWLRRHVVTKLGGGDAP